jgi:sulfite exporter TauE/SafE
MSALLLAVLLASLFGSMHCAGMCGAFVAIACGGLDASERGWRGGAMLQGAYHGGRLVSYAALGAAAGAAGSLVNIAARLAGVQTAAIALAGAAVASFGIVSLFRASGMSLAHFRLPQSWTRRVSRLNAMAVNRPPVVRAGMIGLLTTLLPCGWLYAFAITAAGSGSPLHGAASMVAFWAGTLPALAAVGIGARKLAGPLGRRLPLVTAVLMVVIGLWMVAGRTRLDPVAMARQLQAAPNAQSETPACCVEKP